jgi:hypothetical protein
VSGQGPDDFGRTALGLVAIALFVALFVVLIGVGLLPSGPGQ